MSDILSPQPKPEQTGTPQVAMQRNPLAPVADDGNGHSKGNPLFDPKSRGPIPAYVLKNEHPAWLLGVRKDKRTRTGSEYQEYFSRFVDDVKQHGILQPIIAVRNGDAAEVVDGETRRLAALHARLETVPILLYERELSEGELVMAQLQSGAMRLDFSPLELAAIYLELMQLNGWSQANLARAINVSAGKIAKVLAISKNLCEEVQKMVIAGQLSPRAAYAISRLANKQQQIDLATKAIQMPMAVEAVEERVFTLLGGKKPKRTKPLRLSVGGFTAIITNDVHAAWEAFKAKMEDALRKLKRDDLPPDEFLPGLFRA